MRLILCTLRNPSAEQRDLVGLQRRFLGLRWRHEFLRIFCGDPVNQLTVVWIPRYNSRRFRLAADEGTVALVESEFGFSRAVVLAVACKTIIGEDRPDIAVEFQFLARVW